jgi:ABC-2 type transport system ATP-binding protein
MKAIETKGLSKNYGQVRALKGVSFSVERGEVIGLLGPNGAGKTTLMKILTGYIQPDEGEAIVGGIDVVDDPLGVQAHIGYLPENAPLYGEMAVQEYLAMMASLRGVGEREMRARLSWAIHATGLKSFLTRPIAKLSKGYRQRVGIAQAIVHQPQLLILDEPTSGLDPNQIVEIRDLIRELSKDATIVLSTHILPEVEMTCERVLLISRGVLRADAKLDELRAGNAAVVAIEADADGVREALRGVDGADGVEQRERDGDYQVWRVTSSHEDSDLRPAIFEVVRARGWKISELRSDTRSLEAVFRELAEDSGLQGSELAEGGAVAPSAEEATA